MFRVGWRKSLKGSATPDWVTFNRRFPEITGEIIQKSEVPWVGHHFRHGFDLYTGTHTHTHTHTGDGSRKALVCDSIRHSGMDLYYTGQPAVRCARETLFFFLFSRTTVFWWGHMRCVRLEWRTDWIDCERSLFTPCSWLQRRNVKSHRQPLLHRR